MAFNVAGLGGSFAAGYLGGAQQAQKEREGLQAGRDKEYMSAYLQLIKSGQWEPVKDPTKGVVDGGVLRVGNLGFLRRVKESGTDWQAENYKSLIRAREGFKVGEIKETDDKIVTERYGKQVEIPASRVSHWDGEQWVTDRIVPKVQPPTGSYHTYETPDKQIVQVPPGAEPPPGGIPVATSLSAERLVVTKNKTRAEALDAEANEAEKTAQRMLMYSTLPVDSADADSPVAKGQQAYVDSVETAAAKRAESQALKDGADPVMARQKGELAGQAARKKAQLQMGEVGVEEVEKDYEWLKAIPEAGKRLYDEVMRKVEEIRKGLVAEKPAVMKKQPPPPVRKPIVDTRKKSGKKQVVRKPMPPKLKTDKNGTTKYRLNY